MSAEARAILDRYNRATEPLPAAAQAERRRLIRNYGNTPAQRDWLALYGEVIGRRDAILREILDADEVAI